jgi:hypothetical protein
MATTVWVMREGSELEIDTTPDAAATILDVCEYVRGIALTYTADEVDVSTMCLPGTIVGSPQWSGVLSLIWSPEMYEALQPLEGTEVEFRYRADPASTKYWIFRGSFAAVHFGDSQLNAAINPDMPVSVVGKPTFATPVDV